MTRSKGTTANRKAKRSRRASPDRKQIARELLLSTESKASPQSRPIELDFYTKWKAGPDTTYNTESLRDLALGIEDAIEASDADGVFLEKHVARQIKHAMLDYADMSERFY